MGLLWETRLVMLLRDGAVPALVAPHVALDELGPVRGCGHEDTLDDERTSEAG